MPSVDAQLAKLLKQELPRQQTTLSLIASENIASDAVLDVGASVLSNKYSEGLPGKRYYGGNEYVDAIERLAIARVKKLFRAEHANVQPHAGAIANLAVYDAFLKPGDTILALDLKSGGHLTMGHKRNISGQWFTVVHYSVDDHGRIDMKQVRQLAKTHRPKMIISGASAYPRVIDFAAFGRMAKSVGALHFADISHIAGLVAAGIHPSPVPYADVVTFTTHKTLRGPRGAVILSKKVHAQLIDRAVMPGVQGGPLDHLVAAKAQAFAEALTPKFTAYQKQVVKNAAALAKQLVGRGGKLSTDGTDNHLLLLDVTPFGLTGKQAESRLGNINLIVNMNVLPHDPRGPLDPSGIRLGTPSVTSRGLREKEMVKLANGIVDCLTKNRPTSMLKKDIDAIIKQHPIYRRRAW